MTSLAQRISETSIAPYLGLLQGMSREEKQVVVAFLVDTMEDPIVKTNREIIREKYKSLKVSPELKQLRGCIKLTDEDMKDERIQYILSK